MEVGDKIKMDGEKQRYTVMGCNDRFAILTKPFNAKRTYLYCITDLKRKVRGPCNYILGLPIEGEANTEDGANEVMAMIESGEMEVSRRHCKPLSDAEIAQLTAPNPADGG